MKQILFSSNCIVDMICDVFVIMLNVCIIWKCVYTLENRFFISNLSEILYSLSSFRLQMSSANIDQEPPAKKQRIDSSQTTEKNSNSVQVVSIFAMDQFYDFTLIHLCHTSDRLGLCKIFGCSRAVDFFF